MLCGCDFPTSGPTVELSFVGGRDQRFGFADLAAADAVDRVAFFCGVAAACLTGFFRRGPDWAAAKRFCAALARALVARRPQQYVASASKSRRQGLIFIDWLRNTRGATSVCNWSLRARAGAPVAMPLRWEELGRVQGGAAFDLPKALKRAAALQRDPWEGIAMLQQVLPEL